MTLTCDDLTHVRLALVGADGAALPVPVRRWLGGATPAELRLLAEARGPVLDIGCGPGRHVAALAQRGVRALGIDTAAGMLALARTRDVPVLQCCVFGPLPGEGRWRSALLLDGNVGIGGDPVVLLRRVRQLLRADGRVLLELAPPGARRDVVDAAVRGEDWRSPTFRWAAVGVDQLPGIAERSGFDVQRTSIAEGRWFARLETR